MAICNRVEILTINFNDVSRVSVRHVLFYLHHEEEEESWMCGRFRRHECLTEEGVESGGGYNVVVGDVK